MSKMGSLSVLCPVLLLFMDYSQCCQPPLPAFQQAPSFSVPPSPQFALPQGGLQSGVQQHSSPPAPPISNSIDQELAPISAKDITPYPGYIPPPPAISSNTGNNDIPLRESGLQNVAMDAISAGVSPTGCPSVMSSALDVISCLQLLPPTSMDEGALRCEFETKSCRFQPTSPSIHVAKMPSRSHLAQLGVLSGRSDTTPPTGNFMALVEREPLPSNQEMVIATPITCQEGSGTLSFEFWFIGNRDATLKVCTQDGKVQSCTNSILHGDSSFVSVEVVHPNSSIFEVEIVVSNIIQPTVFIIDNIDYRATMCDPDQNNNLMQIEATPSSDVVESFFEDDNQESEINDVNADLPSRPIRGEDNTIDDGPAGPQREVHQPQSLANDGPPAMTPFDAIPRPTLAIKKLSPCVLLDCTFDKDFCAYSNSKNQTYKPWKWGSSRVGNPHTGIRDDEHTDGGEHILFMNSPTTSKFSGFLYVGTDSGRDSVTTYVLESPNLSITEDILLSLDVYRRSNDITLQICLDSPNYCPYSIPKFEKDSFWREGETFSIRRDTKKIFIKAIQWRKFKWLAIDNIRLSGGHECVLS